MRIADIKYCDTANGIGVRVSLWVQGCHFHCKNCHNPDTWNPKNGRRFAQEDYEKILGYLELPWIRGLSVLGGEPMDADFMLENFLQKVKHKFPDKDIWLWTGYTFEEIKDRPILRYVDVLIDGQFEEDKKDLRLLWRGSSNQRIFRKGADGEWKLSKSDMQ